MGYRQVANGSAGLRRAAGGRSTHQDQALNLVDTRGVESHEVDAALEPLARGRVPVHRVAARLVGPLGETRHLAALEVENAEAEGALPRHREGDLPGTPH